MIEVFGLNDTRGVTIGALVDEFGYSERLLPEGVFAWHCSYRVAEPYAPKYGMVRIPSTKLTLLP